MRWFDYLEEQRLLKLREIDRLEAGNVELSTTTDGVANDITAEHLKSLKSDVAQIRQVFIDEGIGLDPKRPDPGSSEADT